MDKLLELVFGAPWWLVLALAAYGICVGKYGDLYKHEPSRKRWIGYLAQNTWSNNYRRLLGGLLDWIDARLTPEITDKDKPWQPDDARAAWSHGLLNLSLLLAVVYPILSVIVYWAVTNQHGRIGALVLVEGGQPAWLRAGVIGLLVVTLGAAVMARRADDRKRLVYTLVIFGLSATVIVAFTLAGAIAVAISMIGVVLGAGAGAGAGAIAISIAGATAVAGGLAVAGVFAVAGAFAFAVGFAGAGKFAATVAIASAGAFAFAFTFTVAQDWAGRRTGQRALLLMLCAGVLLFAIWVAVGTISGDRPEVNLVILFLAILPLLNALADFGSTGLTRWRLRKGLAGRMWAEMLIDLGGAAAAFFLLGAVSILAIDWIRWADGSALFDLAEFFADLRANPGHYWWLYFTLFSTLIPTVLHATVAIFGSLIHLWPWLRRYIVQGLDAGGKGDAVAGRWAAQALCLAMTASVVAPVVVLVGAARYRGIVGGWVLDAFEGFARLVGAIPA